MSNSKNKIHVLVAPLHFRYENTGTEIGWAYEFVNFCSPVQITALVANKRTHEERNNLKVIEFYKKPYKVSRVNSVLFHFRSFLTARHYLTDDTTIVHHYMPFAIGSTFNLLALMGYTSNRKFVVGPIQPAHTFIEKKSWTIRLGEKPFGPLSAMTLKKADIVIVVNAVTQAQLEKLGVPSSKIRIIPRGIDLKQFSPLIEPLATDKGLRVIATGGLIKRKGMELIIRAIGECNSRNKVVYLDIFGEGDERKSLEELIKLLDLGNRVRLRGHVRHEDIQGFFKKAHLFVSMSRSEAFATAPLEAMACGLPVVATPTGGYVESINEGNNGYLIKQEDYITLAEKLCYLSDKPEVIIEMGRNARKTAVQRYDWEKTIIPKYLQIYEELLEPKLYAGNDESLRTES
jgi:glycosyltransferase involved in cell wall biosynthesis